MPTDADLMKLAARLGERLLAAGVRLVTAESCTGGWISKVITDVPDSSQWFECGLVTYSNEAKMRDLGVSGDTLAQHGAVSEATVREMAAGALRVSGARIAVAVSGVAGPRGGTPEKPVGTVWFSVGVQSASGPEVRCQLMHFGGDREAVRRQSVAHALQMLMQTALPIAP